jgi:hypothetical protein
MLWLSLHLEKSVIKMEYILNVFFSRYFKNKAIFKLSHNALDIAWNVSAMKQETIFEKKSGLLKWELSDLY